MFCFVCRTAGIAGDELARPAAAATKLDTVASSVSTKTGTGTILRVAQSRTPIQLTMANKNLRAPMKLSKQKKRLAHEFSSDLIQHFCPLHHK